MVAMAARFAGGLCHPKGREKLLIDLKFSEEERPIVAQLFSGKPEKMFEAAKLVKELGFDGLDINMGCPDRSIEKSGAGAVLIKDPAKARAIIRAAKEGAQGLPVSVKTRVGYNKIELETWLPELLAEEPAVITVHARTRKEMSLVPARWEHVKRAVEIRDAMKSKTLIFGNGDVVDLEDAHKKVQETGCDGVMLGRAIFGTPNLFAHQNKTLMPIPTHPPLTPRQSHRCPWPVQRFGPAAPCFAVVCAMRAGKTGGVLAGACKARII
jgi:tRNA-dihydrouridine synthase